MCAVLQFLKIAAFVHGEGNPFECDLLLTWLKPASLCFKMGSCMVLDGLKIWALWERSKCTTECWVSLRSFSTFLEYEEFLWLRVNNPGGQNLNQLENLQSDGVVIETWHCWRLSHYRQWGKADRQVSLEVGERVISLLFMACSKRTHIFFQRLYGCRLCRHKWVLMALSNWWAWLWQRRTHLKL